jgi:hypothetical protein
MVLFACDWCKAIKQAGDVWVLGLAAESIGLTAAVREITILSTWDDARACDRLAVHFCSLEHKDKYMAELFQTEEPVAETVIEAKATVGSGRTTERKYMRSAGSSATTSSKKKVRKQRRAS